MKCATALLTVTAIVAVWGAAFAAEPTQTDFDACNREAQSIGSPSASPGGTTSSGVGAGGSASGGMRAGASGLRRRRLHLGQRGPVGLGVDERQRHPAPPHR